MNSIPPASDPFTGEIEYLSKKFFVGPGDDATFKKWGDIAVELALDWLKNPEKRKIHADISLPELANLFGEVDLPLGGEEIEDVFKEFQDKVLLNSVRINNPRYIGHMATVVPWFSVVVDILITSMNQNQVKIETALASSFVERQTLAWLHRLVYKKPRDYYLTHIQDETIALGNITGGGTLGNLTALTVARERSLPDTRKNGVFKALNDSDYSDVAILGSRRVHYSLRKASALLGFGENAVVKIPVDRSNKIDLGLLESKIRVLKKNKVLIVAIIGVAGTTETGNIDPLPELAKIAAREKIWFHVDAAWGGTLLLSEKLGTMLKGIEQADSVTMDGHKLFYLSMSHGAVVFKNPKSLDLIRYSANYIIRKGSVDLGQTSLEGSRNFSSLKLWFSLKMLGTRGYENLLRKSLLLVNLMAKLLDSDDDFERTSDPEICIITYRFIPSSWQKALADAKSKQNPSMVQKINELLNAINVELQKRQRERGQSFVSRTMLESAGYKEEIVVFRAVLTNLLTRSEFLSEILEEQKMIGNEVISDLGVCLP